MTTTFRCGRPCVAPAVALAMISGLVTISAFAVRPQSSQAKQETSTRTIGGRLLDENRKPLVDAVVRPCKQAKNPDGSVKTFFAMHTNRTWATARTNQSGTFTFEGELSPGKYCLAVESGGELTILKGSTGETLQFEVSSKPGKTDWGEIVVRR